MHGQTHGYRKHKAHTEVHIWAVAHMDRCTQIHKQRKMDTWTNTDTQIKPLKHTQVYTCMDIDRETRKRDAHEQ
jgi:hypothetical protein